MRCAPSLPSRSRPDSDSACTSSSGCVSLATSTLAELAARAGRGSRRREGRRRSQAQELNRVSQQSDRRIAGNASTVCYARSRWATSTGRLPCSCCRRGAGCSLALLGALWGSFFNVAIHRLGLYESVVRPRSRCPRCSTAIAWHDNLPIIGWMLLGGKCRHCQLPISMRYPLVEALVDRAGARRLRALRRRCRGAGGVRWPRTSSSTSPSSARWLVIAGVDLDHKIIPDTVTYPGDPRLLRRRRPSARRGAARSAPRHGHRLRRASPSPPSWRSGCSSARAWATATPSCSCSSARCSAGAASPSPSSLAPFIGLAHRRAAAAVPPQKADRRRGPLWSVPRRWPPSSISSSAALLALLPGG